MTYYRKLEKGLEKWTENLEEVLEMCDKIKKIIKEMEEIKNDK